jgi:hypothetical protein
MNDTKLLAPNSTIIVTNRQAGFNATVPGNIAQCRPVSSAQDYLPGQFPLSAVDGAVSTKWEPLLANTTSELIVELEQPYVPVSGFSFDWAQTPPTEFYIAFSNQTFSTTNSHYVNVTNSTDIAISSPFNAANVANIVPYASNTTDVTLEAPVWSGRFARLWVHGAVTEEYLANGTGSGATVAEWAIIRADGEQVAVKMKRDGEVRGSRMLENRYEWPAKAGFGGKGRI